MARTFAGAPERGPRTNPQIPLIVGVIGLALSVVAALLVSRDFWHAYLLGYTFWVSIAIGCLAVQLIHHVSGGSWAAAVLRFLEAGSATFPLLAVLFLPLLLGAPVLYPWTDQALVANDHILQHRSVYYNLPFWIIRAVLYFAIWIFLSWRLRRLTAARDRGEEVTGALRGTAGPGLLLLAITGTGAAFDWLMSLEPHWYSSIYGLIFLTGCLIAGLAFTIVAVNVFLRERPLPSTLLPGRWNDLGSLLLAFLMLWAYVSFSQYLLIWYGNLPEEALWYVHRLTGGWQVVALLLVLLHFALPFIILIFRDVKRNARILGIVAAFLLLMRWLDLYFQVGPGPEGAPGGLVFNWPHIVVPIGIGGLWLFFFLRQLASQPIVPVNDPKLRQQPAEDVPPLGEPRKAA